MRTKTLGRCPDCSKAAPIIRERGKPAEILPHDCDARPCEARGCLVARLPVEMIQFPSGAWYCPSHALLTAAREIVFLHGTATCICRTAPLLGYLLPSILEHFPEESSRAPR